MPRDYYSKSYQMKSQETNDELSVMKHKNSDWLTISILTNETQLTEVCIRSEEMAHQLLSMLTRALNL